MRMRKVFYFGLFLMTMLMVASCSSETPSAAAKKYAECIKNGNYEKFVDGIVIKEKANADEAQMKEEKEALVAMLKEKGDKQLEKSGGIKNIEIVSETISEDGNSAKVILKQTYGNGKDEEQSFNMVKQDGKWKMDINK